MLAFFSNIRSIILETTKTCDTSKDALNKPTHR